MLSPGRISHQIAYKTVKCIVDAGWADVNKLKESSWEKKCDVLTDGGYAHYRERTATHLDELADLVISKYQGDLNNIIKQNDEDKVKVCKAIKVIKGIGDLAVNTFCDTVQHVWPFLALFLDDRSMAIAKYIGIEGDLKSI
ncbi:hypothetical protein B9Z65_910 [Elsinoe australis]|uniref:Uncharacterized protein n=1 Tax=Elsinoe australis TaxID=40998 RepID=A0A2P8AJW1_9PEZI|nr:hypothetical protein B9Z65_910 [Elsinoe australis]